MYYQTPYYIFYTTNIKIKSKQADLSDTFGFSFGFGG